MSELTFSRRYNSDRDTALAALFAGPVPPGNSYRVTIRNTVVLAVVRSPIGPRRDGQSRADHAARRRIRSALLRRDRRRGYGPRAWRLRATHIPAAIIAPTTTAEDR